MKRLFVIMLVVLVSCVSCGANPYDKVLEMEELKNPLNGKLAAWEEEYYSLLFNVDSIPKMESWGVNKDLCDFAKKHPAEFLKITWAGFVVLLENESADKMKITLIAIKQYTNPNDPARMKYSDTVINSTKNAIVGNLQSYKLWQTTQDPVKMKKYIEDFWGNLKNM